MKTNKITITGRVQGVGFRYFTKKVAETHQMKGWVRNTREGTVEIMATGEENQLNAFIEDVIKGNMFSKIEGIDIKVLDYRRFERFEIITDQ